MVYKHPYASDEPTTGNSIIGDLVHHNLRFLATVPRVPQNYNVQGKMNHALAKELFNTAGGDDGKVVKLMEALNATMLFLVVIQLPVSRRSAPALLSGSFVYEEDWEQNK